jgi:GNAT superfamily N-acetyltransferase
MVDPHEFVCTDTLRNGLAVTIRSLRADDRERMAAAIRLLDRQSIYFRLFSYRSELTEAGLDRVMNFDPARVAALVVTTRKGDEEILIGSGRFVECGEHAGRRTAEVAFMVEEDYHSLGIAGRLLRHLAALARERGIAMFEADVLSENKSMLAVFARAGWPMETRRDGGTTHVLLTLPDAQA